MKSSIKKRSTPLDRQTRTVGLPGSGMGPHAGVKACWPGQGTWGVTHPPRYAMQQFLVGMQWLNITKGTKVNQDQYITPTHSRVSLSGNRGGKYDTKRKTNRQTACERRGYMISLQTAHSTGVGTIFIRLEGLEEICINLQMVRDGDT